MFTLYFPEPKRYNISEIVRNRSRERHLWGAGVAKRRRARSIFIRHSASWIWTKL